MMAADYRHIDGLENRLGRHYSRFPPFSPTPALADQSLALRKLCDAGSNRRSRVSRDLRRALRDHGGTERLPCSEIRAVSCGHCWTDTGSRTTSHLACSLIGDDPAALMPARRRRLTAVHLHCRLYKKGGAKEYVATFRTLRFRPTGGRSRCQTSSC